MNIIGPLIQLQQQLRIFHWQTKSHAEHEAFGKAYSGLDDLIDTFVETYMGIFGTAKPTVTYSITLQSYSDSNVQQTIDDYVLYLNSMSSEIPENTDLLNIRDEILGELNQIRYRLTLP